MVASGSVLQLQEGVVVVVVVVVVVLRSIGVGMVGRGGREGSRPCCVGRVMVVVVVPGLFYPEAVVCVDLPWQEVQAAAVELEVVGEVVVEVARRRGCKAVLRTLGCLVALVSHHSPQPSFFRLRSS